jgi:hypothetical protein
MNTSHTTTIKEIARNSIVAVATLTVIWAAAYIVVEFLK